MKRTSFFALTGALALATVVAQAQQRTPSEAATAEQRLAEDLGLERLPNGAPAASDLRNASTLLQTGNGNTARLDQQGLATPVNQAYMAQVGTANVLGVNQTGSGNSAYVSQNGSGNQLDFTQDGRGNSSTLTQRGSANQLKGMVDGNNNEVNIRQDGSNNVVNSEIREDRRTYNITQQGYGNTLNQVESTSQTPQGYNVEMRGNGIRLTIEQSRVIP